MKAKWLTFIFGGITTTLLIICIVLGIALYQKYKEKPSLPKLPALTTPTMAPSKLTEKLAEGKGEGKEVAAFPYYGIPLTSYSYKLVGEFPTLPPKLMVYKVTPQTFDLNSAKELASKFDFKGEPKITDTDFIFSEGSTPWATTKEETKEGIEAGSEKPSQAVPQEPEKFTGRELFINKQDGYISYQNYAVERKEAVITQGEIAKPTFPQNVESKEKAQEIAINFLRNKELLPESYDIEIPEPYGSYFVYFYLKYKDFRIQSGVITVEIGNEGKIASFSMRKIKIEDFNEYPIKGKDEALKVETLEYRIEKVELGYSSSYDKEGKEYLQPVYILSGEDSKGNDFKFNVAALKSEFLEPIQPMPMLKE